MFCILFNFQTRSRAMKFFLLLIVLKFVDFTENGKDKLKALDSINEKLSAFSSAKADIGNCETNVKLDAQ